MTASTRDLQFALHDVLDYTGHYQRLFGNEAPTRELMDAITDEAARFCEGELAPLNRSGDEAGCTFADGVVTAPAGFKAAYEKYVEGGWAGLCGAPEYGGQGLPDSLGLVLENLLVAANPAWTMYPALSRGVVEALEHHGSEEQKTQFLPKLLAGEWTGTMCLTEPHAGSDVGLARTKAEVQADGSYLISGTKIFISAGEHDLSDNIVHLVLARTLEAPEGTRGISMFVVPKFNLDGSRNGVVCGGIEEKMGIHGNATCMLHFEAARGYLVGEENQGMRNMFTMMNAARIVVGLQGVGQAESSLQSATVYAQERLQMRSLSGPKAPDEVADPIIVHPDVRRMLLTQRAIVDGGRVLVYLTGQVADTAAAGVGEDAQGAQDLLDFLTPIVKGMLTELGFESVNLGLQIYGGHGFIRENGMEQWVRDTRITLLYEGTTGIQALDLLGRKILQTQGPGLKRFIAMMNELADELEDHSDEFLAGIAPVLRHHAEEWDALATMLMGKAMENLDEVGAAAVDFLFYSGYLCLAYCWARIAQAAGSGPAEDPYLESKLAAARFYFARMLPRVLSHKTAIEAGADTLMSGSAESFGPF
ncbi:MAG: acyl-CoA dehydrogenase [Gammaproteobacteria bacterium]|nr:MAG: acyl-CoA dehydrogenase [Gammaproteobacteria bacterium]